LGGCFSYIFWKITNICRFVAEENWTPFVSKSCILNITSYGLGKIWVIYVTKTSGHTA
jgi:hypothetical protein